MILEAWLTLAVIVIALVLFATEIVTVDLAALIVMALLLVLGLVTPAEGISGFSNPATITVLAMFILSAGIERTGLIALLAQRLTPVAGKHEIAQVIVIVLLVAPVSAFVNNTAAVAVLIPLVLGIARDTGRAPSKLLIPLSFASMLGGVITLVGTSTNLLGSAISADLGHGSFSMFEFTAPGLIVAAVGMVYLVVVGRFLAPDRGREKTARYHMERYLGEVTLPASSKAVGRTLSDLDLTGRYGVEIVTLTRDEQARYPGPTSVLQAGDQLLILAERDKLIELASLEGFTYRAGREDASGKRAGRALEFYEAIVPPSSRLVGRTVESARFRSRYGGTVIAVRKGARILRTHEPISRTTFTVGDSLLLAGTEEERERAHDSADLHVVEKIGGRTYRREKTWIALAIMVGVVGLAATGVYDILVTALAGAALMAIFGVLTMDELHRAIRWDILFLLAGVIPLGIALQNSGLADTLAAVVTSLGGVLTPFATLVLVFVVTTLLTNVISNNAAVVLLAPIVAATAVSLDLNPRTFILTVMFAASTAFLTPLGYQTNLLVYGPGGYRFLDYVRVGLPLTVILALVTPWAITRFFPL